MENLIKTLNERKEYLKREEDEKSIQLLNIDVNKEYIPLGIVKGVCVLAYEKISEYTEKMISNLKCDDLILDAHNECIAKMSNEARQIGADAVIGVNIKSVDFMGEIIEFIAYGTAIRYKYNPSRF